MTAAPVVTPQTVAAAIVLALCFAFVLTVLCFLAGTVLAPMLAALIKRFEE